jgi:small subunit ribosomal protein S3
MGQKVNPVGFRLGVYRNWDARWYADKDYTKLLHEDLAMRRLITGRLRNAGLARIETERSANQLTIIIQTAKPGIVIGKQGASVDALRDELERISGKKVRVTIHEIKSPEVDAKLVAESVASQLEKRIAFRRAIKQSIMRTMRAGAKGVKIQVSGRLGGSEMSRREWDRDGRVPLHTLRANIDYGQAEARTTFGRIGVTVWIYKGDFVTATGEPILPGTDGRAREDGGDGAPERTRRAPAARAEGAAARPEPARPAASPVPAAAPAAAAAPAPAPAPAVPAEVEPEPEVEVEPEAVAVVEVEDDVDTEDVADEIVDDLPDELADVDISGVDIPDPDAVTGGPEGGPKRAPARRKPAAPRKPGPAKAREPEPEVEEE